MLFVHINKKIFLLLFAAIFLLSTYLFAQSNLDTQKNNFIYSNNPGEILRYRMETTNDNSEKSPSNNYRTEKSYTNRIYYYTKEVKSTESNGDIIFEIKFDSIYCIDGNESAVNKYSYGSSHCYKYNAFDLDSNDYFTYFVLVNEPFSVRVSKTGEILETFGLYNIHKNLFAIYKDTLNESEKESLRGSVNSEELSSILQQEYIIFPTGGPDKNYSWVRKINTDVVYWESESTIKYSLSGVTDDLNNFNGELRSKILGNEYKEGDDITIKVDDFSGTGTSKVTFEKKRSCVKQKESMTKLMLRLNLFTKDDSGYSLQILDTSLKVTLLN